MWVLVLAIVIGVVVLATGMRSSVDEAWIGRSDGDPSDGGDVVDGHRAAGTEPTPLTTFCADRAA